MKLVNVGIKTKSREESRKIVDWFGQQGVDSSTQSGTAPNGMYYVENNNILKFSFAMANKSHIKEITMNTEIKVGQKLSEFVTDKGMTCYMDSKGTLFGATYNLKHLGDREVKKVENGYFEASGFGHGWFKISDLANSGKIIGYKTPTELFGGSVAKGTIYVKDVDDTFYYIKGTNRNDLQTLPQEIVETWEPVYEVQEEVIIIGSNSVPVTVGVEKIAFHDRATDVVTLQEIVKLYSACPRAAVGNYLVGLNPSVRSIRIGCDTENHLFSLDEINQIIIAYKRINA